MPRDVLVLNPTFFGPVGAAAAPLALATAAGVAADGSATNRVESMSDRCFTTANESIVLPSCAKAYRGATSPGLAATANKELSPSSPAPFPREALALATG